MNLSWGYLRCHKKCWPNQFSIFDAYLLHTNKLEQTSKVFILQYILAEGAGVAREKKPRPMIDYKKIQPIRSFTSVCVFYKTDFFSIWPNTLSLYNLYNLFMVTKHHKTTGCYWLNKLRPPF